MNTENQKSWLGRNWPWALPVGCCSGCLIFLVVIIVGFGATVLSVVDSLGGMSPIEEAIERAEKNERVVHLLGEDIESDGFPNGNISISDSEGEVDFIIPIKGDTKLNECIKQKNWTLIKSQWSNGHVWAGD